MSTPRGQIQDGVTININTLLMEHPSGMEIKNLPTAYFQRFGCFVYPEKQGFKNWGEMLATPEVQSFCVLFSNMQWIKLKDAPNVTVLQPVTKTAPRDQTDGRSIRSGPSSIASSGRASSASHDNKRKARLVQRPTGTTGSEVSSNNSRSGKRAGSTGSGDASLKRKKDESETTSNSGTDFSEMSHISISPHNKGRLAHEINKIQWIPRDNISGPINFNALILERKVENAEQQFFIDTTYCDRGVLEDLMEVKNLIRRVSTEKFTRVRAEYNQFEFKKGPVFQHGAAIKMANIDALMGMQLSNPRRLDGSGLVKSNELLYFVDVYGGPGGCAEYFLWKKKWQAKGFGMNPKGNTDYNLEQAEHFPRESFETFYGESGVGGTGEIDKPYFVSKFVSFVKESTEEQGAHIMVASGAAKGDTTDEDQKEIRCKYTILAEFLIALQVLREGGHFVCRVYDIYTPFTVGLVYLMYRAFEQIAIFRPESCLPASSERYLLCKWKKGGFNCIEISNYLSECHKIDWLSRRTRKQATEDYADIVHLMSPERIGRSYRFADYIRRSNADLGREQYHETSRLARSIEAHEETRYIDERLMEIQNRCLSLWAIPDRVRQTPKYSKAKTPGIRSMKLLTPYAHDFFGRNEREGEVEMSLSALTNDLKNLKEWTFMAVGRDRGFFMCLGGNQIFKYQDGDWKQITENLELMNNTLVYADLVDEIEIKEGKQIMWSGFHIIDALILGGTDVRDLPSNERSELITKFAKSMNKSSRDDLAAVRPKRTYELKELRKFLSSIKEHSIRGGSHRERESSYLGPVDNLGINQHKFLIDGVLFIKKYKANFVPADFRFAVQNRVFWKWTDKVDVNIPDDFIPTPIDYSHEFEEDDDENVVPIDAVTVLRHFSQFK